MRELGLLAFDIFAAETTSIMRRFNLNKNQNFIMEVFTMIDLKAFEVYLNMK